MSATIIDAFLTTIGLDGRGFLQGAEEVERAQEDLRESSDRTSETERKNTNEREVRQKRERDAERKREQERNVSNKRATEEDRKREKQTEDGSKKTVANYKKIRNEVLMLAAVFTAGVGIKDFITGAINGAVDLGYLSQNLSMSTEKIKAFQLASERAGGTQAGLTAQLKESVDTLAELNTGGGPNAGLQAFFRWGGSSGDLKDGNTYLLARSKIIADMFKTDPGRAALIAKQMGISEDQFNFIKLGPAAIEDLIKAQERHATVSAKDSEAALELRNQVLDLRDSLQSTATRVVLQLAPAFRQLFKRLEDGAIWVAAHKDDIAHWVDSSVISVREFVKWADSAAESVGGWKNVMIGLIGLKILGTIAAFAQLALALAGVGLAAPAALAALGQLALVGTAGAAGYLGGKALRSALPDDVNEDIDRNVGKLLEFFGDKGASHTAAKLKPRSAEDMAKANAAPQRPPVITPDAKGAQARLSALETQYGLPRGLLDTVWETESSRGKNMLSPAGAEGHFGFMPKTAKEYGLKNPNDFNESSDASARKMRDLLKQYGGDLEKATSAYNWGQGNLAKGGMGGRPAETRDYANKMIAGVQAAKMAPSGNSGDNSTTVQVDNININTAATDAKGIAQSIKPAVTKYGFSNNANTGMTP